VKFRFPGAQSRPSYDVNHIYVTGQSLAIGVEGDPALSTSQPYENVMFVGGVANPASLASLSPLVEASVETLGSGMANLVTSLAGTHKALVSASAAGGTAYDGIKQGTSIHTNGLAQVTAGLAFAEADEETYAVRAVVVVHGEQDGNEGSTTYDDDCIEWQAALEADIQAITGQTGIIPLLHTQMSAIAGSDIPLAQLRAHIAAPGRVILVGPKYHLPTVDGSHLTNEGYRQLGEEYGKVYHRVINQRATWEPLRPLSVSRVGATVTVVFRVPVAPLVFDTTIVSAVDDMGFGWSGGGATITDVDITAPDTVEITLSSATAGTLTYAQGADIAGNLRDSDTTVESLNGYDLFNWCCHFSEVVA
jgi:hypothetical protein